MRIPFHRPSLGSEEEAAVLAVLRSGWLTSGSVAEQLELEFHNWLGDFAIAVASASSGLELVYTALASRGTREIIVPSLTFTSTAMSAIRAGLRCRIIDISQDSLCIDHEILSVLDLGTDSAIAAVHYAGYSDSDLRGRLRGLFEGGIPVIEDAAHALPTRDVHGNVGAGGLSTATVFSFYANKTITSGEGGMIMVREAELAEDLKRLRQHGIDKNSYFRRFLASEKVWDYDVRQLGFKANLPDLLASLAVVQFRRRFELQQHRMKVAQRYFQLFKDTGLVLPPGGDKLDSHSWHLFVVRLPDTFNRDEVMSRLIESGIGCSLHYRPLHRHSYYKTRYSLEPSQFPNSERVFQTALSLPIYPSLEISEVEEVAAVLLDIMAKLS